MGCSGGNLPLSVGFPAGSRPHFGTLSRVHHQSGIGTVRFACIVWILPHCLPHAQLKKYASNPLRGCTVITGSCVGCRCTVGCTVEMQFIRSNDVVLTDRGIPPHGEKPGFFSFLIGFSRSGAPPTNHRRVAPLGSPPWLRHRLCRPLYGYRFRYSIWHTLITTTPFCSSAHAAEMTALVVFALTRRTGFRARTTRMYLSRL